MKLLNRDSDYALRALLAIARRRGEVTPVSALYEKLGVPRPYLRKILQSLGRGGLVRSQRGNGGGFVLAERPEAIPLTKIIRVFQGPVRLQDCLFNRDLCPGGATCPLRRTIGRLEGKLAAELDAVTLASLLADDNKTRGETRKRERPSEKPRIRGGLSGTCHPSSRH